MKKNAVKRPTIYYICPDIPTPTGGIKQLYRHVEILCRKGFSAFVLHKRRGFRVRCFSNQAPVAYHETTHARLEGIKKSNQQIGFVACLRFMKNIVFQRGFFADWLQGAFFQITVKETKIRTEDILVFPEIYGPQIPLFEHPGARKVVFNQNAHYSFFNQPISDQSVQTAYDGRNTSAAMVVSDQNLEYLQSAFPYHRFARIHYGIDSARFSLGRTKKKKIAFMTRKIHGDVQQVISLLKVRNLVSGFELCVIENKTEEEVADILKESILFLSFSHQEGCPMPPMEAMACGCVVVGYDGFGGREYFKEDFCYPVPQGDILSFCRQVERALSDYHRDPEEFVLKGQRASAYILKEYSLEREACEVLDFWSSLHIE